MTANLIPAVFPSPKPIGSLKKNEAKFQNLFFYTFKSSNGISLDCCINSLGGGKLLDNDSMSLLRC